MKTFETNIVRIEDKIKNLVKQLQLLADENTGLRLEVKELREQIDGQKNKIKELDETNKIVKLADGIQSGIVDNEEAKMKINEYIREIDRCIAILSD